VRCFSCVFSAVSSFLLLFFFYCSAYLRGLHSFPTRRSSDLLARVAALGLVQVVATRVQHAAAVVGGDVLRLHAQRDQHVQAGDRSEEHTSELQSRENLVCRLLLEKKKKKKGKKSIHTQRTKQ